MEELKAKYLEEIRAWDWEQIKKGAIANPQQSSEGKTHGCYYLGTVMALCPSGKYYTAFAHGNVDTAEASSDEAWYEALTEVCEEHEGWHENGEGDPCDLYFGCSVEEELDDDD